jgi:hypothetical protein
MILYIERKYVAWKQSGRVTSAKTYPTCPRDARILGVTIVTVISSQPLYSSMVTTC